LRIAKGGTGGTPDGYLRKGAVMSKMPPVPPANRSPKAPQKPQQAADDREAHKEQPRENLDEQGRQGNIHQNTTNQGHQQDR
jgi:hypothetical protein